MPSKLILWANADSDDRDQGRWATNEKVDSNSVDRVRVERFSSRNGFRKVLDQLLEDGTKYNEFHLFAHGNYGLIKAGSDTIESDHIAELYNTRFSSFFLKGCEMKLHTCAVAGNPIGEYFLAVWAQVFLRTHGGQVKGNSATTFRNWDFNFGLGSWVTAVALPGGNVTLKDHEHLDRNNIRDKIKEIRRLPRFTYPQFKQKAEKSVAAAEAALAAENGDFSKLYFAANELKQIELWLSGPSSASGHYGGS